MSGTSNHSSSSTPPAAPTRTLAIIKPHALKHRMVIEPRIIEAGFEIIKERQMQFHPEGDREVLEELFGADADSLSEDPVWVYVLERRRAVEVWNTLMGHEDPEQARINSPNSLRAVFGTSLQHNAFIGSPDTATAEQQINVLFASSPPFPPVDLPEDGFGSVRSVNSSVLAALRRAGSEDRQTSEGARKQPMFRARPIPATNAVPTSQPRMTKAAALRAGVALPTTQKRTMSAEDKARTFANVPGHKRSSIIAVASTAAPTIAPRPTRASALRTGQGVPAPTRPRVSDPKAIFEGVPGHKRHSLGVTRPAVAPPTIAPRATRASSLRTGGAAPAPTARRATIDVVKPTFEGVPGHKRAEVIEVASVRPPSVTPRANRSSFLRSKDAAPPPSSFMFKAPTTAKTPSLSTRSSSTTLNDDNSRPAPVRSQSATSMRGPDIVPRSNRSALLRAKMGTPDISKRSVLA